MNRIDGHQTTQLHSRESIPAETREKIREENHPLNVGREGALRYQLPWKRRGRWSRFRGRQWMGLFIKERRKKDLFIYFFVFGKIFSEVLNL